MGEIVLDGNTVPRTTVFQELDYLFDLLFGPRLLG